MDHKAKYALPKEIVEKEEQKEKEVRLMYIHIYIYRLGLSNSCRFIHFLTFSAGWERDGRSLAALHIHAPKAYLHYHPHTHKSTP